MHTSTTSVANSRRPHFPPGMSAPAQSRGKIREDVTLSKRAPAAWASAEMDGIAVHGMSRFRKGQTILCEGEAAERCFEIVEGVVRAYKLLPDGRRQIVDFLFPGEIFGLAPDGEYGYSADAVTDMTLRSFATAALERVARERPALAQTLRDAAYRELRAARTHLVLLGRKTAFERVASFLVTLSQRASKLTQSGNVVWVPMSQSDIADYLGLTTETVNRVVSQFRDTGMIVTPARGMIRLEQAEELEQIACAA